MVILRCDDCHKIQGFSQYRRDCDCGGRLQREWCVTSLNGPINVWAYGLHGQIVYKVCDPYYSREIKKNIATLDEAKRIAMHG